MGGIGKTALALKLGELLKPQFPDGQIYIDLKGFDSKVPRTPPEAQARVIRSYHPDAPVPDDPDAAGNLYRSVLDGKRAFLLMDNARDAKQVQPLIPPARSVIVVTSRNRFALPGLFAKDLDTLPPPDACDLLLRIAPRIGPQADEIARLCGYLALALRAAGSLIAETPSLDPAEYVRRLGDERKRLKQFKTENIDVEASLGPSYELLKRESALVLRQLAVFLGSFDAAAEETVCQDEDQAHLDELVRKSLVLYNSEARRYSLHDLVRVFATAKLTEDERASVERDLARHYHQVLGQANELYLKGGDGVTQGLDLFDLELPNVQAGQRWAADHCRSDVEATRLCSAYPESGADLLEARQHPRERIDWLQNALSASSRLRDRPAWGRHRRSLGNAYHNLGQYRRAIKCHKQSLAVARRTGDEREEERSLGSLGNAYRNLGEYRRAIAYHEESLAIARRLQREREVGQSLGNLGSSYHVLGEYDEAIGCHEERLAIAKRIGDRLGEGHALGDLGNAYAFLQQYPRAISYHEQSLHIAVELRDRRGEGQLRGHLGFAYRALRQFDRALAYHKEQLTVVRSIANRRGEANALGNLGNTYHALGEHARAIEYQKMSLAIDRDTGDREGEAAALWNMSLAKRRLGRREEAIQDLEASLNIYETVDAPWRDDLLDEWNTFIVPSSLESALLMSWLDGYGRAWVDKKIDDAASLLDDDAGYAGPPGHNLVVGRTAICEHWAKARSSHDHITSFVCKKLATSGEIGIARWNAVCDRVPDEGRFELDGVFLLSMKGRLCSYLKEWRHRRELGGQMS